MATHSQLDIAHHVDSAEIDPGYRYRFDRLQLSLVLDDMRFARTDPAPGSPVPPFDLPLVQGGRFCTEDLRASGPALLVFGSSTCPVTDNAAPGLNALHQRFGEQVRFVIVNVREAHPGADYPQPKSFEAKVARARQLRDLYGFACEIAVDDIDGTFHRAMSPKPNSAYLVGRDGTILFRAQWANDTAALIDALDAVVSGRPLRRATSGGMGPMMKIFRNIAPALDRAGRGAWADMWRVAPPMAAVARLLKALRIRPTAFF